MKANVRIGLMVGAVALVLNLVVAFILGLCSPVLAAAAGAVAGWLTLREERPTDKGTAAKSGALSGVTVGVLMIVGQVVGGFVVLYMMKKFDLPVAFTGLKPSQIEGAASTGFYIGGLVSGLCFGVLDVAAAAGGGAAVGYFATPHSPPAPPAPQPPAGP